MHFHKKACSLGVIGQLLSPFFEFGGMKRGNKVLQLRIESRRRTRHIYIYICCAAAGLNLRKLTMEGGLNLRKYIYVGGRLKPPEVELPPGPYIRGCPAAIYMVPRSLRLAPSTNIIIYPSGKKCWWGKSPRGVSKVLEAAPLPEV